MKHKTSYRNFGITLLILFLCTMTSFVFVDLSIRTENTIMIYLIGVLLIVIETKHFLWGITASLLSILTFNYFFTMPTYSLEIDDPNYIITILVFLIVAFITASLVNKLQQHAHIAHYNERQTYALYEVSRNYLTLSGIPAIITHTLQALYETQHIECEVYLDQEDCDTLRNYTYEEAEHHSEASYAAWCFAQRTSCGHGTAFYEDSAWIYRPLHHNNTVMGVYAVYDETLDDEKELFTNTLISQMVMAIEREDLYRKQEENKVEIEKEKLRNNLLRSISHDLRTPLTGIAGSSALMMSKYDTLDDQTKYNLLKNISSDAVWLNQLVENLLNMTRIQDGKLLLKKRPEVVDDIICEAVTRCEPRLAAHTLQVKLPDDVLLVNMDGRLIIQVLINYIDNAIKHTPDATPIYIQAYIEDHQVKFEVIDDGDGIDPDIADKLFESFMTTKSECSDAKRGVGLGLSISKAIVEAHEGHVYAYNRTETKGAVFGFTLPYDTETEEPHE